MIKREKTAEGDFKADLISKERDGRGERDKGKGRKEGKKDD